MSTIPVYSVTSYLSNMEEKLDQLLALVGELKKALESDKVEMVQRLDQLEQDVATNRDMSAQRMVKKIRRDRSYEFKREGNEKQFLFNDELKDRIEAASTHLIKLKPASKPDTAALKVAIKELQEGAKAIHTRQKLIRIADRLDLGWQVVEAYESDELTWDDEDTKCLEKAQKSAEQKDLKNKKKAASRRGGKNAYRWRATQSTAPGGLIKIPHKGTSVQCGQHWCLAKEVALNPDNQDLVSIVLKWGI